MAECSCRARTRRIAPTAAVRACVALAGAASALAGCGGATQTVSVGGSPPAGASAASTSTAAADQPPSSYVHLSVFRSPTGNIGCMVVSGTARCDIARRGWSPPARPANCPSQVSFGQGLLVERRGGGRIVCAVDTIRDPASTPLTYGTASQIEGFVCVSRATGMTCTDSASGHGFFVSMQSYQLF